MNYCDDWFDSYFTLGNPVFVGKENDDCGLAVQKWFEKNPPAYRHYSSIFGRKNARCVPPWSINADLINEITCENGTMTLLFEVGRMNYENLRRLKEYLESKDITVCSVCNERVFGVSVIRIVVEPCQNVNTGNLSHVLHISPGNVHDVTGDVFYVVTSALNKHLNDCGELEIEKPFNLADYAFKQEFSTLNPIRCQLRKNGIRIDTIDIWDDYLMIKSDCPRGTLTMQSIRKALNIDETEAVICIQGNRWYAVKRWK